MDYEISITFEATGDPDEVVEQLFKGFNQALPGNATTAFLDGVFELTYLVEAQSPEEAFEIGRPILARGMKASGLDLRPIDMHLHRVRADEGSPEPALA